jgi:hypothetical protein
VVAPFDGTIYFSEVSEQNKTTVIKIVSEYIKKNYLIKD